MPLWRVQTSFTGAGVVGGGLSTMYFDGAGLALDAHSAVAAFWTACAPIVQSDLVGAVTSEVALIDETDGSLLLIEAAPLTAIDFTGTGEVAALATQGLMRWRTSTIIDGREIRGRTFIPAVPEAFSVAGRPNASYITTLNGAAQGLGDDPDSVLVVWRRPREADPEADPPVTARPGNFGIVTAVSAWTEFAVLRSRRD